MKVCFVDTPGENGTQRHADRADRAARPDSPIAKFLEKNPAGGQHHVCYEVEDIEDARNWFEGLGKRILGPTRIGAHGTPIFFLHPKDMMGQLTEIMETPKTTRTGRIRTSPFNPFVLSLSKHCPSFWTAGSLEVKCSRWPLASVRFQQAQGERNRYGKRQTRPTTTGSPSPTRR